MSHTFDIRFARSDGLAAFFGAPANRFLWKGAGKLSIDAEGITIAVKRGFANLLSRRRSHRIAAGELTEVYREGDALRLAFGAGDDRQVLPIWTTANAADIVKLLPTTRTIELEHSTQQTSGPFRFDRRMVILLACILVGSAAAALLGVRLYTASVARPVETSQAPALQVENPATSVIRSIAAETAVVDAARRQQQMFETELATLRSRYFSLQGLTDLNAIEALEPHWWASSVRIESREPTSGPVFTGYRETQLAVISGWRAAISLYAAGLRMRDERLIELAHRQRHLAELYEEVARSYVP